MNTFARIRGWARRNRYLVARRGVQLGVLLAFYGTLHWGWQALGQPLLAGNLSGSTLLGTIPLADPFALAQILMTGHVPLLEPFVGAAIVLGIYALVGGRSFCAWVCPVNIVTDGAEDLRRRLDLRGTLHLPRSLRYIAMVLALALSAWVGVAAFEWVSPVGIAHREVIFGTGLSLLALVGVLALDALVLRHGWCGHFCPLGAFWAQVGRVAQLRVAFDAASCTLCGECVKVCPEPQVLNFKAAAEAGMVRSGECTNCAQCIAACPEESLALRLRARISTEQEASLRRPGATVNGRTAP